MYRKRMRLVAAILVSLVTVSFGPTSAHAASAGEWMTMEMGNGTISHEIERFGAPEDNNPVGMTTYTGANAKTFLAFHLAENGSGPPVLGVVPLVGGHAVYSSSKVRQTGAFTHGTVLQKAEGGVMVLYNRTSGAVRAYELSPYGTPGADVTSSVLGTTSWGPGWTSVETYRFDSTTQQRIFLYNSSTGQVREQGFVYYNAWQRGTPSTSSLPAGFHSAKPYRTSGFSTQRTYLLLLSESTGAVEIRRQGSSTSWNVVTFRSVWTTGWTTVKPFYNQGRVQETSGDQLFLMKRSTGEIHINDLTSTGTVSTRTFDVDWRAGRTHAAFWQENIVCGPSCMKQTTFLLMIEQ